MQLTDKSLYPVKSPAWGEIISFIDNVAIAWLERVISCMSVSSALLHIRLLIISRLRRLASTTFRHDPFKSVSVSRTMLPTHKKKIGAVPKSGSSPINRNIYVFYLFFRINNLILFLTNYMKRHFISGYSSCIYIQHLYRVHYT